MNEVERSSQISALFDDELAGAEAELVIRRLLKDPALRSSWGRYAQIGASLRGEPLLSKRALRGDVASRVRAALELEAAWPAPVEMPRVVQSTGSGRRLAWGSALAAGVAAVSILVLRLQSPAAPTLTAAVPAPAGGALLAATQPQAKSFAPRAQPVSRDTPAPSYTTPVDDRPASTRLSAPLVNYVVAHSEYTTPVARFSPLSAVMTGNFDPAENTVEMTEAEVGARR